MSEQPSSFRQDRVAHKSILEAVRGISIDAIVGLGLLASILESRYAFNQTEQLNAQLLSVPSYVETLKLNTIYGKLYSAKADIEYRSGSVKPPQSQHDPDPLQASKDIDQAIVAVNKLEPRDNHNLVGQLQNIKADLVSAEAIPLTTDSFLAYQEFKPYRDSINEVETEVSDMKDLTFRQVPSDLYFRFIASQVGVGLGIVGAIASIVYLEIRYFGSHDQ